MARLARHSDPSTSHVAAAQAELFRASHEAKIYDVLSREIGMTYRKIADATGMEPVAVARRLKAMEERNLIYRYAEQDGMTLWWKL